MSKYHVKHDNFSADYTARNCTDDTAFYVSVFSGFHVMRMIKKKQHFCEIRSTRTVKCEPLSFIVHLNISRAE